MYRVYFFFLILDEIVLCFPIVIRTLSLSNYTTPLQVFLSGMANSCEERDRDTGDIDGQPEEFDSRLWSLKQEPAARTWAVFVHCGVKPLSMNLTAV